MSGQGIIDYDCLLDISKISEVLDEILKFGTMPLNSEDEYDITNPNFIKLAEKCSMLRKSDAFNYFGFYIGLNLNKLTDLYPLLDNIQFYGNIPFDFYNKRGRLLNDEIMDDDDWGYYPTITIFPDAARSSIIEILETDDVKKLNYYKGSQIKITYNDQSVTLLEMARRFNAQNVESVLASQYHFIKDELKCPIQPEKKSEKAKTHKSVKRTKKNTEKKIKPIDKYNIKLANYEFILNAYHKQSIKFDIFSVSRDLLAGIEIDRLVDLGLPEMDAFLVHLDCHNYSEIMKYILKRTKDDNGIIQVNQFIKDLVYYSAFYNNVSVFFNYITPSNIFQTEFQDSYEYTHKKSDLVANIIKNNADTLLHYYNRMLNGFYLSSRIILQISETSSILTISKKVITAKYFHDLPARPLFIGDSVIFSFKEIYKLCEQLPFYFWIREADFVPTYATQVISSDDLKCLEIFINKNCIEQTEKKAFTIVLDIKNFQGIVFIHQKQFPYLNVDNEDQLCLSNDLIPSTKLCKKFTYFSSMNNEVKIDVSEISDILQKLPGNVYVRNINDNQPEMAHFNSKNIEWVCWIPDLAVKLLNQLMSDGTLQVIEVDATFSIPPYIMIIPQGIYGNSGYPLGFYIGLSENSLAYDIFYKRLIASGAKEDMIKKVPILSDGHPAIEKFCNIEKLIHWLCLFHYLRTIGANSLLQGLIRDVVVSNDEETFNQKYMSYNEIVQGWKDDNLIDPHDLDKWNKLNTEEVKSKIAKYKRHIKIMPSNHAEANFGALNNMLKAVHDKNIRYKVEITAEYIMKRLNKINNPSKANILKLYREMKQKAKNDNIPQNIHCHCSNSNITALYGFPLPCIHQILSIKAKDIQPPKSYTFPYAQFEAESRLICLDDQPNPIGKEEDERINLKSNFETRNRPIKKIDNDIYIYEFAEENDKVVETIIEKIFCFQSYNQTHAFLRLVKQNDDMSTVETFNYLAKLQAIRNDIFTLVIDIMDLPPASPEFQRKKAIINEVIKNVQGENPD